MALTASDPTFIFLNSAKEYDVTSLARSTRKTLDIILPWCQSQETSVLSLTKDVHDQAIQYAQAIDLSVVAAHNGFTVAEDAISLFELLQTTETTPEDRQEFLQGTLELARKGRKNALEAKNKFVDVRNVVEGLARRLVDDQKAKASLNYKQLVDGK
ncbi:hypothetical protein BJ165DRAFT_343465 [Panaeolus papilionaceus]|nr:hypothetical protein BJ165DRAFT_343465 [Panaeolus papilionaceus]